MVDFHRMENAEFSGIPLEVPEPRGTKVEMDLDAMTYLSLKEWDAYILALQTKQQALTEEYNKAIELRKQKWQSEQPL